MVCDLSRFMSPAPAEDATPHRCQFEHLPPPSAGAGGPIGFSSPCAVAEITVDIDDESKELNGDTSAVVVPQDLGWRDGLEEIAELRTPGSAPTRPQQVALEWTPCSQGAGEVGAHDASDDCGDPRPLECESDEEGGPALDLPIFTPRVGGSLCRGSPPPPAPDAKVWASGSELAVVMPMAPLENSPSACMHVRAPSPCLLGRCGRSPCAPEEVAPLKAAQASAEPASPQPAASRSSSWGA